MTEKLPHSRVRPAPSKQRQVRCHFLIRATAIEMAGVLYEEAMHDNATYAQMKAMCPSLTPEGLEALFLGMMWPRLVEQARATLVKMLRGPSPQSLKDQIADALIKDNEIRNGRARQLFRI